VVGTRSVGVLGGYVRGTTIVAFVDALVIGIALAILGVPLAFPLALVVFLGAFIPLVGASAAGILAALIALVANGPIVALIVIGIVIGVNQLEGALAPPAGDPAGADRRHDPGRHHRCAALRAGDRCRLGAVSTWAQDKKQTGMSPDEAAALSSGEGARASAGP
jgi:hypothetical protein